MKRRRRASWCDTTASTACCRRAASTTSVAVSSTDWFQCHGCSKPCSKNHCCTGVRPNGPSCAAPPATGPAAPAPDSMRSATAATCATVCNSINCLGISFHPRLRARAMICNARIESPPSSKKFSLRPTRSSRSVCAHTAASASSASPCGASNSPCSGASASGSALRSSLPFAVNGNAASTTRPLGTM
ncbi:hypothetical protein D3C87_1269880 [compost metagenome]